MVIFTASLHKLTLFNCNQINVQLLSINTVTLVSDGLLSLAELAQKVAMSEKISTNMVDSLTRDRFIKVL